MFDKPPGRLGVIQSCDVFVDADGVLSSRTTTRGLHALQYEGS
jgi:hypothetical protein